MKVLSKISLALALSLALFSCEDKANEDKFSADKESGWVQFIDNAEVKVSSCGGQVEIPVKLYSPVNTSGLTVNYSITSVSGNLSTVLNSSQGTVEIPAGKLEGVLVLDVNPVTVADGEFEFDLELVSTSRSNVSAGLSDGIRPVNKSVVVSYVASNYDGYPVINAAGGIDAPQFECILTPTLNPYEFTIDTAWGPEFVAFATGSAAFSGQYVYSGTIQIDPLTNNVTVIGDDAWATGGTGTIDDCDGSMNVTLSQILFGASSFTVTVDYVRQ